MPVLAAHKSHQKRPDEFHCSQVKANKITMFLSTHQSMASVQSRAIQIQRHGIHLQKIPSLLHSLQFL